MIVLMDFFFFFLFVFMDKNNDECIDGQKECWLDEPFNSVSDVRFRSTFAKYMILYHILHVISSDSNHIYKFKLSVFSFIVVERVCCVYISCSLFFSEIFGACIVQMQTFAFRNTGMWPTALVDGRDVLKMAEFSSCYASDAQVSNRFH